MVGGTSAVAPLWAALAALMNEQIGTSVGFMNPKLYSLGESVFHDITSGNNDDMNLGYYSAKTGWDPCTGLGSPNGTAILDALSSGKTSAQRVQVPGSAPKHGALDRMSKIPDPAEEVVAATLVVRRSGGPAGNADTAEELLSGKLSPSQRGPAERATAADPGDMSAVCSFVEHYGLKIQGQDPATRASTHPGQRATDG